MLIPKQKHALIKFCRLVLNKGDDITETDLEQTRKIISDLIHLENLSPTDIKNKYDLQYTDFGSFLKSCLGIQLKSLKDAVNNYNRSIGRIITDDKLLYRKECAFKFNIADYPNLIGFDDFLKYGIFNTKTNTIGMCRDHIVSIEYGWRNEIDPKLISHPANCQLLSNIENISKGADCWMTVEQLQSKIDDWDIGSFEKKIIISSRTKEHKEKISESIKLWHSNKKESFKSSGRHRKISNDKLIELVNGNGGPTRQTFIALEKELGIAALRNKYNRALKENMPE